MSVYTGMQSNVPVLSTSDSISKLRSSARQCIGPHLPIGYGGVIAAMVTPCRESAIVDPIATRRLAGILIENGCNGLFVAGSTGELALLDEDDRRAVVAAACEGAGSRGRIYAGISGTGVKQTVRYARNAASDGAAVAVVMAPFFLKLKQAELLQYLWAVADASPIPVALYHHLRAATPMNPETVARAAEHQNIVAIKDTSLEVSRIEEILAATKGLEFSVLQGNESLIVETLERGGTGMVTALANIVPEWHADLYAAHRTGNASVAAMRQSQITKLRDIFSIEQVSKSISAFTYTLRLGLARRGWLDSLAGMADGFSASDLFRQEVIEHLILAEVPVSETLGVRIDVGHAVTSESRGVA